MKYADLAMTLRPGQNPATTRWVHGHLRHDPQEAAYREAAAKYATPDNILQIEAAFASWEGRMADYAVSTRKQVEFYRAAGREEAQAGAEANLAITNATMVGGAAVEALKKKLAEPGTPLPFVAQAAVVLAASGDGSVVTREAARIEREGSAKKVQPMFVMLSRVYAASSAGRTAQAAAILQAAIKAEPRAIPNWFYLAQVQERGGRAEDAIASYRHVVDGAPTMVLNGIVPIARLALGRMLAAKGDAAGAKTQFDILAAQWAHADADFAPAIELHQLAR